MKSLIGAALMLCSTLAAAAPATVDMLQSPAWLDRGGLSVPLIPAAELMVGDTIRTGPGSRAVLRLEEGSIVKLGENARFTIERAQPVRGGAYQAALNVVTGAFRFTTQALSKPQPRDVTIKVAQNATIGIRGTDVWGRGGVDRDIVCLIEGNIEVTGNDGKVVKMDKPLQLFASKRDSPPEPLSAATVPQLENLARETEMEYGKGAAADGPWKIIIDGFPNKDAARQALRTLRGNGYPGEIYEETRIIIRNLMSELAAGRMATQLKTGSGYKEIRVTLAG